MSSKIQTDNHECKQYVIYCLKDKYGKIVYIGYTMKPIEDRLRQHKNSFQDRKSLTIESLKFASSKGEAMIIEGLLQREFNTMHPHGLNKVLSRIRVSENKKDSIKSNRIQIAVPRSKYKKAKVLLIERGVSWQRWGEAQIDNLLSGEWDDFCIPLLDLTVNKDQFKNKVQEKLVGSLREQAFVLLAKANGQTQWVEHKENEIERLGLELLDLFDLESKGRWSKIKAATEAIEYYRSRLKSFVTRAHNQYLRYYKTEPKKTISIEALAPFLDHILSTLVQ